MNHNNIRITALAGIICIAGIITVQIGWFAGAYSVRQAQEELRINLALKEVAAQIYEYNQLTPPSHYMVKQAASNYYVVMTNSPIVPSLLEYWLANSFKQNELQLRYEYGIYDCESERLVFSNRVDNAQQNISKLKKEIELPEWAEDNHYFALHLPGMQLELFNDLKLWTVSSALVLLITLYFVYLIWMVFRQKRLSELQRDFVNNMAHEFSTPISSIHGAAQLLRQKGSSDHQYLEIICQESERLQMQVERSLEIDKIGEHQKLTGKKKIHLLSIVTACVEKAKIRTQEAFSISVRDESECDIVLADPFHLESVFQNLIENAYKYRKAHQSFLKIKLYNSGRWLNICFHDNGIGIDEKELRNIFRKFYRISHGNIHNHKGFGLGLYYVKHIVQLHGGHVKVESTIDKGSIFTISLPCSQ